MVQSMIGCTVRIESTSEGETKIFSAAGAWDRAENAVRAAYLQDGDEVSLRFNERVFSMRRRGQLVLSAVFRAGARTSMRMRSEAVDGEIPLRTDGYVFRGAPEAVAVEIDYELLFEGGSAPFHLTVQINSENL